MTNYGKKRKKKIKPDWTKKTVRVTGFNRFLTSLTGLRRFNYMADPIKYSNRHTIRFTVGLVRPAGPVRVSKLWLQRITLS
ncbi:hypothetical protein MTR_5g017620 [Medicago truncatula]|uniref:Uncharacterized protein n=1 Tax=Medicago truncatula TaxID=3880 RepID=G7K800_MEDTR|nr:hypothetical protein MTR_5g017620 [Medicago truncatula]